MHYDVAIIGGGPGGSATAIAATRAGLLTRRGAHGVGTSGIGAWPPK